MASTIQVRVDDELKAKSEELFRELGTDTTTAIRMFLTQAVAMNGFPFEIRKVNPHTTMTEEEILEKIQRTCERAARRQYQGEEETFYGIEE